MSLTSSRREYLEQYIVKKEFIRIGQKTTICLLTIYNGFEIVGSSACLNKNKFNKELGELQAYENALQEFDKRFAFLEQDKYHLYKSKEKD